MAEHAIETQWMGNMQFNSLVNGHTIIMDAPERVGGEDHGPIPKPFILTALSGCTGMDVIGFLKKQGIQLKDFEIKVTGELSKQTPIAYTAIHVIYLIIGAQEQQEAVLHAVQISQEKYCGVSYMLKKVMPVTWEVQYNGKEIYTNKKNEEHHAAITS